MCGPPATARVFSLNELEEAFNFFSEGGHFGKIVLSLTFFRGQRLESTVSLTRVLTRTHVSRGLAEDQVG